jgi:hypothetical protein
MFRRPFRDMLWSYGVMIALAVLIASCSFTRSAPAHAASTVSPAKYGAEAHKSRDPLHIIFDPGGVIADFVTKFIGIREARSHVVVDGMCVSACTLMLPILTRDQVCVTAQARFGFHSASSNGVYDPDWTNLVWTWYPRPVREILAAKGWTGGEQATLVFVDGSELGGFYRDCTPDEIPSS